MGFLRKLFGPKAIVIESPSLGIIDLTAGRSDGLIEADEKSFFHHFESIFRNDSEPLCCDVLVVYAEISKSGTVTGSDKSLREIIRDSYASIVIVASDNDPDDYIAAAKNVGYGHANLVMTIGRDGSSFGIFFDRLFSAMKGGETMPVAWNRLAPQIPGYVHTEVPRTMFACERGQLSFANG